jgi:hypothetical protein
MHAAEASVDVALIRTMERVSSVMSLGAVLFVAASFGAMGFFSGLAVVFDHPVVGLGIWCMFLTPIPVVTALLVWLLRWTRGGSAPSYVASMEEALGVSGQLVAPSLLLPLLTPEWTGTVDGREVSVRMRRTAGFLSPVSPRGGLGIPWTLQAHAAGTVAGKGKVGFTHPKAATMGIGLLGLSKPVEKNGVQIFVGGRDGLADNEALMATASAIRFAPTTLFVAGPDGVRWTERMSDLPPEDLAARVKDMVALLLAMEAAA